MGTAAGFFIYLAGKILKRVCQKEIKNLFLIIQKKIASINEN